MTTHPKTILVTGGSGYIGSHTVRALKQAGYRVVIYDNLLNGHSESVSGFTLIEGDLADESMLNQLFDSHSFSAVIHLAAYIEMAESMQNPTKYFKNNVCGSLNLFNAMIRHQVKNLIFSSTAGVYGNSDKIPTVETVTTNPTNPYGESKLMIEKMLAWFAQIHGLNHVILRYFNAAGASLAGDIGEAHTHETHLIPNVFKAVQHQAEKFTINGGEYPTKDGTTVRDYIHVLDLAEAHILSLEYLLNGGLSATYNIGSGRGFTTKEVVEKIISITSSQMKIVIGSKRAGDAVRTTADSNKFQKQFSWRPSHSDLDTIITSAWQWHRQHPHGFTD